MKTIKILSNMPGFTKGEKAYVDDGKIKRYGHTYHAKTLIERGWAEEMKDEVDIDKIKKEINHFTNHFGGYVTMKLNLDEYEFFKAYSIVKAVIEQLNGEWKPDLGRGESIDFISYSKRKGIFQSDAICYTHITIIPYCKDKRTVEKVVELCEPELKVLFGVK